MKKFGALFLILLLLSPFTAFVLAYPAGISPIKEEVKPLQPNFDYNGDGVVDYKDAWEALQDVAEYIGGTIGDALNWLREQATNAVNELGKQAGNMLNEGKKMVENAVNEGSKMISGGLQGMIDELKKKLNAARQGLTELTSSVTGFFQSLSDFLWSIPRIVIGNIKYAISQFQGGIRWFFTSIQNGFNWLANQIKGTLEAFGRLLWSIPQGFFNAIGWIGEQLSNGLNWVGQQAYNAFKNFINILFSLPKAVADAGIEAAKSLGITNLNPNAVLGFLGLPLLFIGLIIYFLGGPVLKLVAAALMILGLLGIAYNAMPLFQALVTGFGDVLSSENMLNIAAIVIAVIGVILIIRGIKK